MNRLTKVMTHELYTNNDKCMKSGFSPTNWKNAVKASNLILCLN